MGTTVITINVTSDQASPSQETTVIDACGLTPSLRSRSSLGSLRDLLDISADICDASPFSVAQGGYADLHTATYLGNKVALKLLRILNAPDEAKKVGFRLLEEKDQILTPGRPNVSDFVARLMYGSKSGTTMFFPSLGYATWALTFVWQVHGKRTGTLSII